jgi:predicted kinase
VAIGGLSGSGKSTAAAAVAAQIGAAPGARVLSSDRIRKRLHGVAPQTRLGAEAYRPDVSARVYAELREAAAATLAAGHSVVVDAVFDRPDERDAIEAVARSAGVAFQGIWLEASEAVLLARVAARRNDPSDADDVVVRRQLERDIGTLTWTRHPADGRDHDWSALHESLR